MKAPSVNIKDLRGRPPENDDIDIELFDHTIKIYRGSELMMHLFYHYDLGWTLDYHKDRNKDERISWGKLPDV